MCMTDKEQLIYVLGNKIHHGYKNDFNLIKQKQKHSKRYTHGCTKINSPCTPPPLPTLLREWGFRNLGQKADPEGGKINIPFKLRR